MVSSFGNRHVTGVLKMCDMQVALEQVDMYMRQAEAFMDAVQKRDPSHILSVYSDAVESYKVSKRITEASSTC